MGVLGIIPGMPHVVFIGISLVLGYGAWFLANKPIPVDPASVAPVVNSDGEATWDDLQPVDQLGLELGYRLITLVDKNPPGRPAHPH
jgi:flagellar biosynthesis protein FlhA